MSLAGLRAPALSEAEGSRPAHSSTAIVAAMMSKY
jgi:hypothetical protein